jgi:hypothetical protein
MKGYGGIKVRLHTFYITYGGEQSASKTGYFTPREIAPGVVTGQGFGSAQSILMLL